MKSPTEVLDKILENDYRNGTTRRQRLGRTAAAATVLLPGAAIIASETGVAGALAHDVHDLGRSAMGIVQTETHPSVDITQAHRVTVVNKKNGETVWQIAEKADVPGESLVDEVGIIENTLEKEGLPKDVVQPGQEVDLQLNAKIGHVVPGDNATSKQ